MSDRNAASSPQSSSLLAGVKRSHAFAWASLDFANSGYTTVILTAVFNAYFVSVVAGGHEAATLLWTLILSVSYLVVMALAPLIGAYADLRACKRSLLWFCTAGCVLATALLATVGPGAWVWAAVLLIISNVSYATHQDLSAAFLPEIARPDRLGRVSGYGWAWGYLGGLLALGLSLAWVMYAQSHAMDAKTQVAGACIATAALFALAAVPSLWVLRDRNPPLVDAHNWSARRWFDESWGRLRSTWADSHTQKDLRQFLWCVLVYHAGVQTVITLAAVYAQQVMGFTIDQTILLVLLVNITAAAGAFLFGYLQDRLSHKKSLALALLCWMGMVVLAWQSDSEPMFWIAANLAGLAMGASQSGARAAVAYLARPDREAETFGLWGVAVNCSAVIGPLTYGLISWVTDNDHRLAMLVTGGFFVVGFFILWGVDFDRGRRARVKTA